MLNKLILFSLLIFLLMLTQTGLMSQVIINEINYHSADDFDTKDWLELHNTSDNTVNIGAWYFKDDNEENSFSFPEGTTIEANGFLVVCRNIDSFSLFWPQVLNYVGEFDFGLNNGGELIRLFNASGTVVDTVHYDDESPWPVDADGLGPTLQLSDPSQDNADAQNWFAATGTPGGPNVPNSVYSPEKSVTLKVFPNPVVHSGRISIDAPDLITSGELVVFDHLGHRVLQLSLNGNPETGFKASDLTPGLYTVRFSDRKGNLSEGTKFIIVR
jgi:hypothetical protein